MVVLTDSQPGSPVKSVHTWSNSQPGTSQAGSSRAGPSSPRSPLPRGVVRSPNAAEFNPPPPYVPSPSTAPLLPGPPQKPRPSVAKRFFSAFVVAVIILMGFNIIGHIIGWVIRSGDSYEWDNNPWKEDGNVLTCENSWSPPRKSNEDMDDFRSLEVPGVAGQMHIPAYPVFSAFESFQLPINSSLHYLIARGSLYSGVAVIRGDEGADPNVIGVNVTVRYSSQRALSRAKICMLGTSEGGHGIGIYTPRNRFDWGGEDGDRLRFLVTVTIPISRASLLNLNAFDTNLANFRHKFEQLGDRVQFEHLSVEGTNGVIQSDSLYVSEGMIKTTNGGINGQFNTTDSLILQTTNGVVDIDVGITNDDTHRASNLFVQSTNGRLESRVSLLTTHDQRPQPKGGHFTVQTRTTNGQLNVQFPTSPIDSLLDLDAHTTNSPADISLHASYEGSFRIKTSNGGPEVDNEHARDPTGKGRYRTVNVSKSSKNEVQGKIFWGHEKDHNEGTETGRAVIQTSNGWARLRLR